MFESLIITLREGIEAALVLGIILIFLRRTGRAALQRWVFWGLGVAVAASLAGAVVLDRLPINQEAYEGVMMLIASAFVVTMVVWMWRHGKHLKGEIEGHLEKVAGTGPAAAWGLFLVTFLLIFREGVEMVLLLATVRLSTDGMLAFLGGLTGLGMAVLFGIALVKGSMRLDLARFFKVTGILLLIFAAHLLAGAVHELAEAGTIPIGRQTMRVLGPIVKSQALVAASLLSVPLLLLILPGRGPGPTALPEAGPERRLVLARAQRDRRWRATAAVAGFAVIGMLVASMAFSSFPHTFDPPELLTPDASGEIRLPVAGLEDGHLHRFGVEVDGVVIRFLVMQSGGKLRTTLDACQLCGAYGYVEHDFQLICLACAADINTATLGAEGGCNPLPLPSRLQGDLLIVRVADLSPSRESFFAAREQSAATPTR